MPLICAPCERIRNERGYWEQIETYVRERCDAEFSHSLCPDRVKQLYQDFHRDREASDPQDAGVMSAAAQQIIPTFGQEDDISPSSDDD